MTDPLDLILQGLNDKLADDLETHDDMMNAIIVTGAIWMALGQNPNFIEPQTVGYPDPGATNQIVTGVAFMKSQYRITVERIQD
jgi:hypothetical protein